LSPSQDVPHVSWLKLVRVKVIIRALVRVKIRVSGHRVGARVMLWGPEVREVGVVVRSNHLHGFM